MSGLKIRPKHDELWTMKDGKEVWVSDMTEEHAKNSLRVLIRKIKAHNAVMQDNRDHDWFDGQPDEWEMRND